MEWILAAVLAYVLLRHSTGVVLAGSGDLQMGPVSSSSIPTMDGGPVFAPAPVVGPPAGTTQLPVNISGGPATNYRRSIFGGGSRQVRSVN